jgi:hypothetical protein
MPVTAESSPRELQTEVQASVLELQRQTWKARGHAKEKWVERALAEPIRNPREAEKRAAWIRHALDVVRCGREEIKYQAALIDAYAEHLSALEMTLMAACESKHGGGAKNPESEQRT